MFVNLKELTQQATPISTIAMRIATSVVKQERSATTFTTIPVILLATSVETSEKQDIHMLLIVTQSVMFAHLKENH